MARKSHVRVKPHLAGTLYFRQTSNPFINKPNQGMNTTEGKKDNVKRCPECLNEIHGNARTCEKCGSNLRKNVTFGLVLAWLFSLILLIEAIGVMKSSTGAAVADLIGLAIMCPPLVALIDKRLHIHFSRPFKVIAVIVLMSISAGLAIKAEYQKAFTQNHPEQTSTNTNSAAVIPTYKKGEEIMDGDLKIVVTNFEDKGSEVTDGDCRYYCSHYKADGKYMVVGFTVENTGKESASLSLPDLVDEQDRTFDRTYMLTNNLAPAGYEQYSFDSLNPGTSKTYYTVYDVATTSTSFQWVRKSAILQDVLYKVNLSE